MVEKPIGRPTRLGAYLWSKATLKEMGAEGVTGSGGEILMEFWLRVEQTYGDDPDWIAILIELLPIILAIIQALFAVRAYASPLGGMFPEFEPRHAYVAARIAGQSDEDARAIAKQFREYRS